MALHRLGKPAEAKEALAKAEKAVDGWIKEIAEGPAGTMPFEWPDLLQALLTYREAQTLITGSRPAEDPRLIAAYTRAQEIVKGDAFTFMEAGREHVRNQEWDDAAASFASALDNLSRSLRPSQQHMPFQVEMVEHPEVFRRLVALRPSSFVLWWARGQTLANRREWALAAADYAQALELMHKDKQWQSGGLQVPEAIVQHYLCLLRQLAGDEQGYRDLCATLVGQADGVDNPNLANLLARACSLAPAVVKDPSLPERLAEQAVASSPQTAWYLFGLGAAHYRAGHHAEAIARLEESLLVHPAWAGRGQNYVVLAMACQQLGHSDEARTWLQKAQTALKEMDQTIGNSKFGYAASSYLSDWLALLILLPEAKNLIGEDE
jgi:tetratricopeptide (TPR) repeat protein